MFVAENKRKLRDHPMTTDVTFDTRIEAEMMFVHITVIEVARKNSIHRVECIHIYQSIIVPMTKLVNPTPEQFPLILVAVVEINLNITIKTDCKSHYVSRRTINNPWASIRNFSLTTK